jgi:hypothetical protein
MLPASDRYRRLMGDAVKVLACDEAVHDAREITWRLLADGAIRLAPNAAGTAVAGPGTAAPAGRARAGNGRRGAPAWSKGWQAA